MYGVCDTVAGCGSCVFCGSGCCSSSSGRGGLSSSSSSGRGGLSSSSSCGCSCRGGYAW